MMKIGSAWFHQWTRPRREEFSHDSEVCGLREKLEKSQRDVNYLKFQLTKTRADKFELDEQLKSELRFHVQEAEAGTGWDVVTDHCCLGGCDMNVRAFRTERDALLFARLLKAVDYRPSHNIACPACYEEHMKGRNCL